MDFHVYYDSSKYLSPSTESQSWKVIKWQQNTWNIWKNHEWELILRKLKLTRVLWVKAHTHDQRDMFLALCMLKSFHSESFRSGFWFNHWRKINLLSNCYEMITCNFITESKLIKKWSKSFDSNICQCRTVKFFEEFKKISKE